MKDHTHCERCDTLYPNRLIRVMLMPDTDKGEWKLCMLCATQLGIWLKQSPKEFTFRVTRRVSRVTDGGQPLH